MSVHLCGWGAGFDSFVKKCGLALLMYDWNAFLQVSLHFTAIFDGIQSTCLTDTTTSRKGLGLKRDRG